MPFRTQETSDSQRHARKVISYLALGSGLGVCDAILARDLARWSRESEARTLTPAFNN